MNRPSFVLSGAWSASRTAAGRDTMEVLAQPSQPTSIFLNFNSIPKRIVHWQRGQLRAEGLDRASRAGWEREARRKMAWTTALNLGKITLPNGCPVSSSSLSFYHCPRSANRLNWGDVTLLEFSSAPMEGRGLLRLFSVCVDAAARLTLSPHPLPHPPPYTNQSTSTHHVCRPQRRGPLGPTLVRVRDREGAFSLSSWREFSASPPWRWTRLAHNRRQVNGFPCSVVQARSALSWRRIYESCLRTVGAAWDAGS